MDDYDAVVWFTAYRWSSYQFTQTDQTNLANYLDSGGRLYLTGQMIHYMIDVYQADNYWFYENYLDAIYLTRLYYYSYDIFNIEGIPGDPITDGLDLYIDAGDGANNNYYLEALNAGTYSSVCLDLTNEPYNAGIRTDQGVYRSVYTPFSFEAIDNQADRIDFMDKVLTWIMNTSSQGAPITTITLDGVVGQNNWFISDVTVTLEATDDGSVNATYYRLDGGEWYVYSDPFVISDDGTTLIEFYSDDDEGNEETIRSKSINIDATPPTVKLTKQTYYDGLKWIATVNDQLSGPWKVEFYVDGVLRYTDTYAPYEWTCYDDGAYTVTARAFDMAGNWAEDSLSSSQGKKQKGPP